MLNRIVPSVLLCLLFFSSLSAQAQDPTHFGFATGTCTFSGGGVVNMPFFYAGKGYPTKISDVPTLGLNLETARYSLPDDYQQSCLAYFYHGCKYDKVFKEFNIPPMESIGESMSYTMLNILNNMVDTNTQLFRDIVAYSSPTPLITRFNNLSCVPAGKIDDIPNNPNPDHVPHPNDVLPVGDKVMEPYLKRAPRTEPSFEPNFQRIYVPSVPEVIHFIQENWDVFTLSLCLAIIGIFTVYVGANGVPALLSGGASLPSFGASAPILAAALVAVMVKYGAWTYSSPNASQLRASSTEELIMEFDEEKNTFILDGKINGVKIERHEIDLDDIQDVYNQIQEIRQQSNQPTVHVTRERPAPEGSSKVGF